MKDLYTFDANEADALETYDDVNRAYRRIFSRIGLPFAVVSPRTTGLPTRLTNSTLCTSGRGGYWEYWRDAITRISLRIRW